MGTDAARSWRGWVIPVLGSLVTLAALRLAIFMAQAAVTPSYGFVAYYTAAWMVADGQPAERIYDDTYLHAAMAQLEPEALDVYWPNPPSTLLMFLPLVGLSHDAARVVWTVINVGLFVAAGGLLLRSLALPLAWQLAFWLVALSFQPLWANFAYGQSYVVSLLLFVLAWRGFAARQPVVFGSALGAALALKVAGLLFWPLAVVRRQWRALLIAVLVAAGLAVMTLPIVGTAAWVANVPSLLDVRRDPSQAVTAYQTLPSLLWHLLSYDVFWNPAPVFVAPQLAAVLLGISGAALLAASLYAAWAKPEPRLAFAGFTLLGLIISPLSLDYHYTVALLPMALITAWLREQPRRWWPWLILAAGIIGMALPWPYQHPRIMAGAWAVFAYPRLYGALLLWALVMWGSLRAETQPFATLRAVWVRATQRSVPA